MRAIYRRHFEPIVGLLVVAVMFAVPALAQWGGLFGGGGGGSGGCATSGCTITGNLAVEGTTDLQSTVSNSSSNNGGKLYFNDALLIVGNTETFGGLSVGNGGTRISLSKRASASIDVASISAGACSDNSLTVTGAATGNECSLGLPSTIEAGLAATCFVSATNTVQVRLCNVTGSPIDPAEQTFSARTWAP